MSGILRWESEWSDVGREVRLEHPLKSSEVRLERFPIDSGSSRSVIPRSSELMFRLVSLLRFPILSGNDSRLKHSLKFSERRLDRFPILEGNDLR